MRYIVSTLDSIPTNSTIGSSKLAAFHYHPTPPLISQEGDLCAQVGLIWDHLTRNAIMKRDGMQKLNYTLATSLEREPLLKERLHRLRTVPAAGGEASIQMFLTSGLAFGSLTSEMP